MKYVSFDVGVRNLAFCVLTSTDEIVEIEEWKVCSITESSFDFGQTTEAFLEFLHNEFYDKDLADVTILIENQPVMKNPVMKSIQIMIYTFFHMMRYQLFPSMTIRLVSASNKLKCKLIPEGLDALQAGTKYALNKKKSIKMCEHYVTQHHAKWAEYYSKHKKKDDLADCFLQAMYIIEKVT